MIFQLVGRLAAVLFGFALLSGLLFWPVLFWGWTPWTGAYVGFLVGRLLLIEATMPLVSQKLVRAVRGDVR